LLVVDIRTFSIEFLIELNPLILRGDDVKEVLHPLFEDTEHLISSEALLEKPIVLFHPNSEQKVLLIFVHELFVLIHVAKSLVAISLLGIVVLVIHLNYRILNALLRIFVIPSLIMDVSLPELEISFVGLKVSFLHSLFFAHLPLLELAHEEGIRRVCWT
jgi:hypothetical protein